MKHLDDHLNHIQEDTIQEIDPITGAVAVGSLMVIANFVALLLGASGLIKSIKVDKTLSDRINKILDSGNKWIVHIYPTSDVNAFSLGFGRHIFVTTTLLKALSKEEVDAVLLHEAYHSDKKHTIKDMAYKYPMFYLLAFIAAGLVATGNVAMLALAIPAMFIADKVGKIVYDIIVARRMEYNADSYAAKKGYGQELISALKKLESWAKAHSKNQSCGRWCQIVNKIDTAIDEHPSDKKRIENILRQTPQLAKVLKTRSFGKIKDFVTKAWGK